MHLQVVTVATGRLLRPTATAYCVTARSVKINTAYAATITASTARYISYS